MDGLPSHVKVIFYRRKPLLEHELLANVLATL